MHAVSEAHPECVRVLVESGAAIDTADCVRDYESSIFLFMSDFLRQSISHDSVCMVHSSRHCCTDAGANGWYNHFICLIRSMDKRR
jgi:hypothetical protein